MPNYNENNTAGVSYSDAEAILTDSVAIVIFLKKNGEIRVMLCTRCLAVASQRMRFAGTALNSHDNKCNRSNGNLAVIDLEIGEPRSFNISRLVAIQPIEVRFYGQYEEAMAQVNRIREEYDKALEEDVDNFTDEVKKANIIEGDRVNDLFKSDSLV